jgi:curved DNA-binding protein CbpA
MSEQNFYEILEVGTDATLQDVERAYRIARATYQPASSATYSLFSDDENAEILRRIEEAYAVLVDPRIRREYDARLRREGVGLPATLPSSPSPAAELPRVQPDDALSLDSALDELDEPSDGVYDGPALRRIRLRRGIELDEISAYTKINETYLGFIEQNRYEDLPSAVYLRGFVRELAKCLKLDPRRVADSYMAQSAERPPLGSAL